MQKDEFVDFLERIKSSVDIQRVIGARIPLDKHNKAICPFHDEKHASFSVNLHQQYFYCFGCGVGGDVIRFIELYEKRSFWEALSLIGDECGITALQIPDDQRKGIEEQRLVENVLAKTTEFYRNSIHPEVRRYLVAERGITPEILDSFQIGYANGGLKEYLDKAGFSQELCLKTGVLVNRQDGTVSDYYYHRIVFPFKNRGRVTYLSARSFPDAEPKYLHLPGERTYLFNEAALWNEEVYLVEGPLDCLSLEQAGYPCAAIVGTHLKQDYLPKLSRCRKVFICLDADHAGREGAIMLAEMIGDKARIVQLPDGQDVNDFFKNHGKEDFQKIAAQAKDSVLYRLSEIPADIAKIELPARLEPLLKLIAAKDRVRQETYLKEIQQRFRLDNREVRGYREMLNQNNTGHKAYSLSAKPVMTALFDGLIDLVADEAGNPAFLIKRGEELAVMPKYQADGILAVPPRKEQIPWLLPNGANVVEIYKQSLAVPAAEADSRLFDDIVEKFKTVSELPGEEYYPFLAAWVMHTYLLEKFQFSPVISFYAVPERGKTRTGKALTYLAYRGVHLESLREAYIFRMAEGYMATLFFDVRDLSDKVSKGGSEDIMLHRFEKGARVPRVLYPDRGQFADTVYFKIFGATLIATNEELDEVLGSRAVSITMPETYRRFENNINEEMFIKLKERLLAFKARHSDRELANIEKPERGRLGDILKPLLQVILLVRPEREPEFRKIARIFQNEKYADRADTQEAQILSVVIDLESEVHNGLLPVKMITDTLNVDYSEKFKVTYQRVGRMLKSLSFKKIKSGNGSAFVVYDLELLARLKLRYGLRTTPETPVFQKHPE